MEGARPMHESLASDRIYVTVDILALTVLDGKLCLMLSRRKDPPYEGRMALPGRFVGQDETAETAACRLIDEMMPVTDPYLEQLYTFTDVNRDPRGRVISTAYLVIVPSQNLKEAQCGKNIAVQPYRISTGTIPLRLTGKNGMTLTSGDLAFDHGRIIETGVQRLQGKIDYTDIGFRFLDNTGSFSISELQMIYEAVLGTALDSSNFRRTIFKRYEQSGRLRQTAQETKCGRGRPAVLYRFDL